MDHVDLNYPMPSGEYSSLAYALYHGHLRRLAEHAPVSSAVQALTANAVDNVITWLRVPNAPNALLETAARNFRGAAILACRRDDVAKLGSKGFVEIGQVR